MPRRKTENSNSVDIATYFGIVTSRVKKQLEEEKKEKKQKLEEYLKSLGYVVINRVGDYVLEVQDNTKTRHYLCIFDMDGRPCMFHTMSLIDMARHVEACHDIVDKKLAKELAKMAKEGKIDPDYLIKTLPTDTAQYVKKLLTQ